MNSLRNILVSLVLVALAGAGCAAADDEANTGGEKGNVDVGGLPVVEAENRLFEHDVQGANAIYSAGLRSDPNNGSLAVGKAVTDLLLLPYSPEFGAVLTDGLGARRPLNANDDVLYRSEGLLDLLSRGVAFEDDGVLSGIETILEGELPWERGRLSSPQALATGVTSPVNQLTDALVGVADAMQPMYDDLDIALQDASFGAFYLPGTVLFEDDLSLELGKSEVAFLRSGIGLVRAGIYFAAAYEASWSLDDAFGSHWEDVAVNPEDPAYVEGWTYDDYVQQFLSDVLARDVRQPGRLSDSRDALRDTLVNMRAGLEFGIARVEANETDRELSFADADLTEARDVIDLLQAVEDSLYGPTAVPFTEPDVTMDLSSFFQDGRTLPAEIDWFERTVMTDEFGELVSWELTDAAFESFFVTGVFTPPFTQDTQPQIEVGSPNAETTLFDTLAGDLTRTVESTYGTR